MINTLFSAVTNCYKVAITAGTGIEATGTTGRDKVGGTLSVTFSNNTIVNVYITKLNTLNIDLICVMAGGMSMLFKFDLNTSSVTLFTHINNNVCAGTTSIKTSLMNGMRTNVPRSSPHGPTIVTSGIKSGMNSMTNVKTSLFRSCYKSLVSTLALNITMDRISKMLFPLTVTKYKLVTSVLNAFFMENKRGAGPRGTLAGKDCTSSTVMVVTSLTLD